MKEKKAKTVLVGLVLIGVGLLSATIAARTFRPGRWTEHEFRGSGRRYREINGGRPLSLTSRGCSPERVLVKFQPSLSAQAVPSVLAAYGSQKAVLIPQIGIYKAPVPQQATVAEFLAALNRNPHVQYAEPDSPVRIQVTPNDEYFRYQYGLSNSGQALNIPGSTGGKAGADIKALDAWEQTHGDPNTIIAILDTGLDMTHPDIKNKIVSSGRDFVNDDEDATDDHWHGTHVAGIAAAETDNGLGMAGVAWKCRVLPVKVIDDSGFGYYSQLIDGLIWAADHNVQVINMSLGGDEPSDSLLAAMKYAYDRNVLIVASSGNDGDSVLYPAAYDAYCLAVAATDGNDDRTAWSNPGSQVDVAAPGDRILSLVPTWYFEPGDPAYAYASGTSMAAPHVAGFAALIKSLKPWLTVPEIMNIIRYSADDVNAAESAGKDDFIGYGRINMERALSPYKLK